MASPAPFDRLRHAYTRIGPHIRAIGGPRLLTILAASLGLVMVDTRAAGAAAFVLVATAGTAVALGRALRVSARGGASAGDHDVLAGEIRRWRSLVAVADQAIATVTRSGIVTTWNAAAERMYGWRAHEIAGRSLLEVVAEARRAEVAAKLEPRSAGDGTASFETVALHRPRPGRGPRRPDLGREPRGEHELPLHLADRTGDARVTGPRRLTHWRTAAAGSAARR
ncbi:PAS domain-containing protein [Nannocystis pusilla]|uniref:PAS domain-containing protein n=1 Tax=Nannocystis pusilla TaxID=889268 RepID=A0ABS7TIS1_9BACT|nr:PAS domain-containing protein [Nannocystis pusilla]MBZ5708120.1 PAS domain-containing protein [Nannocystis pusilla]